MGDGLHILIFSNELMFALSCSGLVGPLFIDTHSCFAASATTTKEYSGCPQNTFMYGYSAYKKDEKGYVSVAPALCCSMYFSPTTTSS